MGTFLTDLQNFIHAPFRQGMDVFSLFLAIGLVIVFIILWTRILAHLGEA